MMEWTYRISHIPTTDICIADAKNYCRNPGGKGDKPWCYTMDTDTKWEYCDTCPCNKWSE